MPGIPSAVQVINADRTSSLMALYISELALLDYAMLVHLPSVVAAACVYLARLILQNPEPWVFASLCSAGVGDILNIARHIFPFFGRTGLWNTTPDLRRRHSCRVSFSCMTLFKGLETTSVRQFERNIPMRSMAACLP